MKDCHIHTVESHDGKSTIGEYIEAAREKGIDEMTFTEHWDDYEGVESSITTMDVDANYAKFLAECEKTDFKLNYGIELGLQPHDAEKAKLLAQNYEFDFIIGSAHITNRMILSADRRFFEGRTRRDAYMQYFDELLEDIEKCADSFDVCGHIDYIVRYGGYVEKSIEYAEFADVIDAIFALLIRRGKGIEVNTSGYRYGIDAPHPSIELLRRYRELGGEIITLGSDAHRANDLGSHFLDARDIVEAAGFREIAFYRKRVPEFITTAEFFK